MKGKIIIEVTDQGVAHLQMRDTDNKNIFSPDLVAGFIEGMDRLESDHKPKVCIVSGLKETFSGGARKEDLLDLCEGKILVKDLLISEKLVHAPFPLIAAMEGHAIGGGLIIAACCDIVVAAREMRYGAVFMNMGFTPGMGCTTLLAELMGPFVANEMMFTGKMFKGSQLAHMGTNINYILPSSQVMAKAEDIAKQISEKKLESIYLLKGFLNINKKKRLTEARKQEDLMHRISFGFKETRQTIEDKYGK
jgi:polyketide biosynthesis enoyl-CoA hydratase PksI